MKIGVIGIGGIAKKAYLPTYAKMRQDTEFIFATRNEEVRRNISEKYGFTETVATRKNDRCLFHPRRNKGAF